MAVAAPLDVMLQRHGRCGMACRSLRLLDVLRLIVNVRQNRRSESNRCNALFKARILLNPSAHASNLRIAQRLFAAYYKMICIAGLQYCRHAWNNRQTSSTRVRLGFLRLSACHLPHTT